MDTQRAVLLVRRWWLVLVVGTLLAAGAAYLVSHAQPRIYEATAMLEVNPGIGTIGGGGDFNEYQAAWSQAQQDAQVLRSGSVAQAAINQVSKQLHQPIDAGTLLQNTATATGGAQSLIVSLAVRSQDPHDASLLANAMMHAFLTQDAQRTASFAPTLATINQQIRRLSLDAQAAQSAPPSVKYARLAYDQDMLRQLQQDATSIELRQNGLGASVSPVQQATPPTSPISPRTSLNTLIAAVLAFFVLTGAALLIDYFDPRPRSAEGVASTLGIPLLATISPLGRSPLPAMQDATSPLTDEYRLLRANIQRSLTDGAQVLAVAGAQPGHGASTTTTNLAAVSARAGARVILIDANLRHPTLHSMLGLPNNGGLSALLSKGGEARTLLQDSSMTRLRVLTAGTAPHDVIDLVGSAQMRDLLTALRAEADLILVDAGAATVPDAPILASLCDATVLVARLHGSTRSALTRIAERLCGAPLKGVVVPLFTAHSAGGQTRTSRATAVSPTDMEHPARTAQSAQ